MPRHFIKTHSCGCIVKTTSVGTKKENDKVLYLIGGHNYIHICETCNQNKNNDIYILSDDDITDGSGNDGWIECNYYGHT